MSPDEQWPVPASPVERAVLYLEPRLAETYPGVAVGIESRPADHKGLHVRVLRTGGGDRTDWPLVTYLLTFDISHPDALAAEAATEALHSLIDQWPWVADDVHRHPQADRAGAVWNPLDDPRVPAYTLSTRVALEAH